MSDCHGVTVHALESPLLYVMAPEGKISGAGKSDMPKRSQKELPLGEKVKVLDLKKQNAAVARSMVRTGLPPGT